MRGEVQMISFLKNWALSIVTLVLFLLLVEIMMPSGSTKKFVNLVAGFILMLAIIRPVTELFTKDIRISETFYIDSSFLDRSEISRRSSKLEDEQRQQVLNLYRERLLERIEQAVMETEGVGKARADVIINEDYESGRFGEVKRVYLELYPAFPKPADTIEVQKVEIRDKKPSEGYDCPPEIIEEIKAKIGRITNIEEHDVVVSVKEAQGGE